MRPLNKATEAQSHREGVPCPLNGRLPVLDALKLMAPVERLCASVPQWLCSSSEVNHG